jgi:hypothetical protein
MAMSQNIINSNVVHAIAIVNKTLQNIIIRQRIILDRMDDSKNSDLALMDMKILQTLQQHLDYMKERL